MRKQAVRRKRVHVCVCLCVRVCVRVRDGFMCAIDVWGVWVCAKCVRDVAVTLCHTTVGLSSGRVKQRHAHHTNET